MPKLKTQPAYVDLEDERSQDPVIPEEQYKQALIDEFENDARDEAEADLEQILLATEQVCRPNVSDLILQLESTGGLFPISATSCYRDTFWRLDNSKFSLPIKIFFESSIDQASDLKRALCYYMLPDNSLMGGVKSNRTTLHYSRGFSLIERYVFRTFHLTARFNDLELISERVLNQALDKARDHSAKRYFGLFRILKLWILLSDQHLIPAQFRINVPLDKLEIPERKLDISSRLKTEIEAWTAYSEEELGHLMEYALFWLEKVAPKLERLEPHIKRLAQYDKGRVVLTYQDKDLEDNFRIVVDEKVVMELNRTDVNHKNRAKQYRYTWKDNYSDTLNHIRSALFIMIALVTGARASELAPLSITDISNDKPDGTGDYWIRIVRWKTAADPVYNGEVELLPLPRFVAECAFLYDKLANFGRESKRHWLFQSIRVMKAKATVTPDTLLPIIAQLREELPIERLHAHRFRKTIAEILIHQDERNLDLIRALFGHKTFKMTMQYIARNPAMVRCVATAIEVSYTEELHDIITQIHYGAYSGQVANRIAEKMQEKPEDFPGEGKQLRITLMEYVSNLLKGGEPLFIRRTAVGTYCVTAERFEPENYPPCIQGRDFGDEVARPDPGNCHYECRKIVVLEKARASLEGNITFYQRILDHSGADLPEKTHRELLRKIKVYQYHLANLNTTTLQEHNPDIAVGVIFKQAASGATVNLQVN